MYSFHTLPSAPRLALLGVLLALPLAGLRAQSIGIGTSTPDASAVLDLSSSGKGLLFPRMTRAQRDAIASPATGLTIYQTDNSPGLYTYNGTGWLTAGGADNLGDHTATQNLNLGSNLLTGGGSLGLRVAGTGHVGIGLSSPTYRLDVQGPTNTHLVARLGSANSTGATLMFDGPSRPFSLISTGPTAGAGPGKFGLFDETAGAYRFVVDPNGNLGVGSNSPSTKLEVAGTVFSTSGGFRFPDNTVQTSAATNQTLSLSGQTLSISNGNAITLPAGADNLGNHTASTNLNLGANLLTGGGSSGLGVSSSGQVGIGTTSPDPSAALDVVSTTKGVLPPRMTQTQRDAIATPATGLHIFNTNTNRLNFWDGISWQEVLGTGLTGTPGSPMDFAYTGSPQTYTVPAGVYGMMVVAQAASGGNGVNAPGGLGARISGLISVTPGEVLTVMVGGQGGNAISANSFLTVPGGFNGGGNASRNGGGGGGASDVRRAPGALANRLLVAGGGGGGGSGVGGAGGLPNGGNGAGLYSGGGGTTTSGGAGSSIGAVTAQSGSAGAGGASANGGGGGGSGLFGGGGGTNVGGGGGGGSTGAAGEVMNVAFEAGTTGNGWVRLLPLLPPKPVLDASNFVNVPGDNLGSHTASTNLNLGSHLLTGGGSTGVRVDGSGRVGIGTTAPTQALDVNGTIRSRSGGVQFPDGTTQATAATNQTLSLSGQTLSISSGNAITLPAGADNLGNHTALTNLNLGANLLTGGGSTGLSVSSSGNVGIGTGPFSSQLSMGRSGGTPNTALGRIANYEDNGAFFYGSGLIYNGSNYGLGLWGGSGNSAPWNGSSGTQPHLTVETTGRVGIGVFAPTQALDVNGTIRSRSGGIQFPDNTVQATAATNQTLSVSGGNLSISSGNAVPLSSLQDNLGNHTATTNLNLGANLLTGGGSTGVRVDGSGNVGIGTAVPGYSLDVQGPASTYFVARLGSSNTTGAALLFDGPSRDFSLLSTGPAAGAGASKFGLFDEVSGTYRWVVDDLGGMGIGTTSPAYRLDVQGQTGTYITARLNSSNAGGTGLRFDNSSGRNFTLLSTGSAASVGPGKLAIYDETGGAYRWWVDGSSGNMMVAGSVSFCGGAFTCSDRRYKKDITPLQGALANVLRLNGYTYFWRRDEFKDRNFTADKQLGFIAQEVEALYPEMVMTDKETGYKSVDYAKLTPVLVEALKELHAKLEAQTKRAEQAEAVLNSFEARLRTLEAAGGQARR